MYFFACERCNHVDSVLAPGYSNDYVCTQCTTGHWHGLFEHQPYDPKVHKEIINRTGPTLEDGSEPSFG